MAPAPTDPLDAGTRLAAERTHMAYDRTMMAWVRTATSLISFGFTIYKFFDFDAGRNTVVARGPLSPRLFALSMIGTGLFALLLSTIEYRRNVLRLRAEFGGADLSAAGVVAAIVSVLGLLAFIAALMHA